MSHTPKIPGINVFDSLSMGGDVKMVGLPTSDPEVEDKLWNDNGGIKVSAGSPTFNITTRDTETNIIASTPTNPTDEVTVAYGTDTGDFYIYDGSAWYIFKDDITNTYSLSFDGTNDYVDCGTISTLSQAQAQTLSLWFKPENAGELPNIGWWASSTSSYGWASSSDNSVQVFNIKNGINESFSVAANVPNDTNWHHYVAVFDSGSVSIYIDGSSVSTGTATNTTLAEQTSNFYIGQFGAAGNSNPGLFDEVALFNTALDSSQVASIYNNGTPADLYGFNPTHWWRMGDNDSGTGTTITDQGSGGNNGTLTNGPTFSTTIPS